MNKWLIFLLCSCLGRTGAVVADDFGDLQSSGPSRSAYGEASGDEGWVEFKPASSIFPEGGEAAQPGLSRDTDSLYEYRVGRHDLLEITVFQAEELNHKARVNSRGYISFPLIGKVKVSGLTLTEAEETLAHKLGEKYLQDPHVSIYVAEFVSRKFTVDGEVKDPGVFPLKGPTTLVQAIAMADGLDRLADSEEIVLFRQQAGGRVVGYIVDLDRVREGEIADPYIVDGDTIVVPRAGDKAFIEGFTRALRGFVGFGTL